MNAIAIRFDDLPNGRDVDLKRRCIAAKPLVRDTATLVRKQQGRDVGGRRLDAVLHSSDDYAGALVVNNHFLFFLRGLAHVPVESSSNLLTTA